MRTLSAKINRASSTRSLSAKSISAANCAWRCQTRILARYNGTHAGQGRQGLAVQARQGRELISQRQQTQKPAVAHRPSDLQQTRTVSLQVTPQPGYPCRALFHELTSPPGQVFELTVRAHRRRDFLQDAASHRVGSVQSKQLQHAPGVDGVGLGRCGEDIFVTRPFEIMTVYNRQP